MPASVALAAVAVGGSPSLRGSSAPTHPDRTLRRCRSGIGSPATSLCREKSSGRLSRIDPPTMVAVAGPCRSPGRGAPRSWLRVQLQTVRAGVRYGQRGRGAPSRARSKWCQRCPACRDRGWIGCRIEAWRQGICSRSVLQRRDVSSHCPNHRRQPKTTSQFRRLPVTISSACFDTKICQSPALKILTGNRVSAPIAYVARH
jgi:hypothetical protein